MLKHPDIPRELDACPRYVHEHTPRATSHRISGGSAKLELGTYHVMYTNKWLVQRSGERARGVSTYTQTPCNTYTRS